MNNTVQRIGPQEGAYVQQIADTLFRGSAGIILNKPLEELLRVGKSGACKRYEAPRWSSSSLR